MDLRIKKFDKICREIEICIQNLADFMLSKKQATAQMGFYSTFEEQLSHSHPLYILANKSTGTFLKKPLQNYIQMKAVRQSRYG